MNPAGTQGCGIGVFSGGSALLKDLSQALLEGIGWSSCFPWWAKGRSGR